MPETAPTGQPKQPDQVTQRERERVADKKSGFKLTSPKTWFRGGRGSAPQSVSHEAPQVDNTNLQQLQQDLVTGARDALSRPTFLDRNNRMADVVASVAAPLTARSIGRPDTATRLESVFLQAARTAGETFRPAFVEDGSPIASAEGEYKTAMKAAGGIARTRLPEALSAVGIEVGDVGRLLQDVTFDQVVQVTAEQLKVDTPLTAQPDAVKQLLHDVTPSDDYFASEIDRLPFSAKERKFSPAEIQALDIAVRLANATWMVGQVHRAAWGETDRIDPAKRWSFNPYDLLKQEMYDRLSAEGRTPEEALTRVAFEVWKDVIEIRPRKN